MNRKNILLLLFIVISLISPFALPAFSQNPLSGTNQALRYSPYSKLALKVIPVKTEVNTFKLQMVIEKIEEKPDFASFNFGYAILDSYNQAITSDNIIQLAQTDLVMDTNRHWYFEKEVKIPDDQKVAIAFLKVVDTRQGDEYFYHVDLKSAFVFDHPDFGAYFSNGIPFDPNYLNQGASLLFKTESNPAIHAFHYSMKFGVPYPPMETRPGNVPEEISPVDAGDFLSNVPKELPEEGYYFFQTDTNSRTGYMLKTTHETFPKVKDWDEMVQMVTYISTQKEHQTLLTAEDKKQALDEYWIKLAKNPDTAKSLIKNYFRMIEYANILFTNFKAGWKTDQGMVYTVMGPPHEVYFHLDKEVWAYLISGNNSKIHFTFVRAKTILSPHFYTLDRSRSYQPIWFKNISQWRNGKMAF